MINEEEFIYLFEKDLNGECTPEEKKLLESYKDDIVMPDKKWHPSLGDRKKIYHILYKKVTQRIASDTGSRKIKQFFWLKIAATVALVLSISVLVYRMQKTNVFNEQKLVNHRNNKILPGRNRAYLTLANGSVITLDDIKNGEVSSQSGVNLRKIKDGVLAYDKSTQKISKHIPEGYNTINTPRGGQYQIVLSDGTKVWLNSASSLKYPTVFAGKQREVELSGEGYFEVAKNPSKPFRVLMNGVTVQVLGTHFNIMGYDDEKAVKTTLLEGSVKLINNHTAALLRPGEQGFLNANKTGFKIRKVDIDDVIAWKNGLFAFNNEDIQSIMKRISRWYDVDIVFPDNFKRKNFGGAVSRFKDVTDVLDALEATGSVHFKVEGRRITVMP